MEYEVTYGGPLAIRNHKTQPQTLLGVNFSRFDVVHHLLIRLALCEGRFFRPIFLVAET